MRDGEGIYTGNHKCSSYGGISTYKEKTCCGGRVMVVAMSVCTEKGIVESEMNCNARCRLWIQRGKS